MATPADQRLLELLEKWLTSLELHAKYSSLDDDSYSQIQAWPEHQRPSRWIVDLAMQKAKDLKNQVQERIELGDAKFSDSLELMTFLANLVGSQHIERFIPLAETDGERPLQPASPDAPPAPPDSVTGTREMPKFLMGTQHAPAPPGTAQVARSERKTPEAKAAKPAAHPAAPGKPAPAPTAKPAPAPTANPAPASAANSAPASTAKPSTAARVAGKPAKAASAASTSGAPTAAAREQVIADAARLVQWGRKWYELAELIARMADRPSLTDVRRILKDNKAVIDNMAGRG
jgi:hypothetical protein